MPGQKPSIRLLDWLRWQKPARISDTKTLQKPRRFGHWLLFLDRWRVIRFLRQTGQLKIITNQSHGFTKLEMAQKMRGRSIDRTIEVKR